MVAVAENRSLSGVEPCFGVDCSDGTNWYAYVNNNPINMIDPTGLSGTGYLGINVTATNPFKWVQNMYQVYQDKKAYDSGYGNSYGGIKEPDSVTLSFGVYVNPTNDPSSTGGEESGFYWSGGAGGTFIPEVSLNLEIGGGKDPEILLDGTSADIDLSIAQMGFSAIVDDNNKVIGGEITVGASFPTPVNVQAFVEKSGHISFSDLFDKVSNFFTGSDSTASMDNHIEPSTCED